MKASPKILTTLAAALFCAALLTGCGGSSGGGTSSDETVDLSTIPAYSGVTYIEINGNEPEFTSDEMNARPGTEVYGKLDSLGRCTGAFANVGLETMPTEKRGDISEVRPSGWKQNFYDFVEKEAVYNRSHLIGYQLTAENANEENLITGTRYMNADGMEPFESMVASYVKRTKNHVIYRVVPIFVGKNMLASGVHMEAESVEDNGRGICFNIYCYNVQPGVGIDYATGENWAEKNGEYKNYNAGYGDSSTSPTGNKTNNSGEKTQSSSTSSNSNAKPSSSSNAKAATYVLNTGSMKFHKPSCQGAQNMSGSNKKTVKATRDELIKKGYAPCGSCNP